MRLVKLTKRTKSPKYRFLYYKCAPMSELPSNSTSIENTNTRAPLNNAPLNWNVLAAIILHTYGMLEIKKEEIFLYKKWERMKFSDRESVNVYLFLFFNKTILSHLKKKKLKTNPKFLY